MIHLKTIQEIEVMKEGGKRLREVLSELVKSVRVGMTTEELDKKAEKLILEKGGEPSFKTVKGYKWTICSPVNEQAVHTPPSDRKLKSGDVLTIDIGLIYKGFHTDTATSLVVGQSNESLDTFLKVGKETLMNAISKARVGGYLGEISQAMEKGIYSNGYFILKDLTGHGIGKGLHEDPYVFNYVDRPIQKTYKIPEGLVIAVEIIYSMGSEKIAYEKEDGWSIISEDKSIAACFEHTIALTNKNTYILT